MHNELFSHPAIISRYQDAPYVESRERFLRIACENGYATTMLQKMASALLVTAKVVHRYGAPFTPNDFKNALARSVRLRNGRRPSAKSLKSLLRYGEAWAHSANMISPSQTPFPRFYKELHAYANYMSVEQGLSSVTIANRHFALSKLIAWLPTSVNAIEQITPRRVEEFLKELGKSGWSRRSLYTVGSSLKSFLRFSASRGWSSSDLSSHIDLPRLYKLEEIPQAQTDDMLDRLQKSTEERNDPSAIRDHAILSLLIHYGLRRSEVQTLRLNDINWDDETITIQRPKLRRSELYPITLRVGNAILRYIREVRPRCEHRSLFLTLKSPTRPLSGSGISVMVNRRLTELGTNLERRGPHSLRHACAAKLLDSGFTLKQIADHLGHRSLDTTRIYTKIDLHGLRQVAEIDLGTII